MCVYMYVGLYRCIWISENVQYEMHCTMYFQIIKAVVALGEGGGGICPLPPPQKKVPYPPLGPPQQNPSATTERKVSNVFFFHATLVKYKQ